MKSSEEVIVFFSKYQLQRELDLPRTGDGTEDTTSIARKDTATKGVGCRITVTRPSDEDCVPVTTGAIRPLSVVRNIEVGVIENVKEF